jgi:hypothetical protein
MNRDEMRDRAPEIAPEVHCDPIAWLAPADSQRGGTWIAVNECGVVACLLNGYLPGESPAPVSTGERKTRGAIVPWLMRQGGIGEITAALEHEFDPAGYPSFTLVLAHREGVQSYTWRGAGALQHQSHDAEWSLFSSSSWNTGDVIAWRVEAFNDWRASGCATHGELPAIHLLQPAGRREWSPLMDRERTCTRSITQVEIASTAAIAIMRYWRRDRLDSGQPPLVRAVPLRDAREYTHHG